MSDLPPQLVPAYPVHDPVYGRVWLTALEMAIINTPEFQRLRGIGQLTPVDLVFPGATHNRFAHSIGATHVMGLLLRQKALQDHFIQHDERLVVLLRLAALLHDVGHLPFSHVGEMAYNAAARAAADGYVYDADGAETVFDAAARARAKPALHEELSVLVIEHSRIAELIDASLPAIDGQSASQVVAVMVRGGHADIVARNLLSSDLDCDRLDYLLRDSLAAGLVYGNIDLDYLIGNLVVARDRSNEPLLAIDQKHGLLVGEHFLLARYYHYAQFISHKTVAGAEVNLVAAMLELIRLGRIPDAAALRTGDERERLAAFMTLSDARLLVEIEQARTDFADQEHLVEAATRLVERKLLKSAARDDRLEVTPRPGENVAHRWDTMLRRSHHGKAVVAEQAGVDPQIFCYRRTSMPLTGIEGDLTPTQAVTDEGDIQDGWRKAAKVCLPGEPPELLISRSPVLGHLSRHRWATRRVFIREPLDRYEPRQPSEELARLAAVFAAEDDGADE